MLKGIAASAGIGIGKIAVLEQQEICAPRHTVTDARTELERWNRAVDEFCEQISQVGRSVREYMSASEAEIITAQIVIARDPELHKEIVRRVTERAENIEHAFSQVFAEYEAIFSALEDELMRARAADFRDIRNRMLSILTGRHLACGKVEIPSGSVLVADDISPSQALSIRPGLASAIITKAGTRYSHIAILCRASRIPGVVGLENILQLVRGGEDVIVDGCTGEVILNPTPEELNRYDQRRVQYRAVRQRLDSYKNRKTLTRDGKRIRLCANLTSTRELTEIVEKNVDGIGLFRSEYIYMNAGRLPDEHQQFLEYRAVVQSMRGKPAIIRTLDVGGDKPIPYLGMERERNPLLGFRAVRHSLKNEDMFKTQLRALLRAAAFGNLRIMIPLVTSISELRRVRELLEECKSELQYSEEDFDPNVKLGVMIETPAAALRARDLAGEADFFSLGTNDLTQYTLVADRGNKMVADRYDTLHPAVLRLIYETIQAAADASIHVGICGEAASDPMILPFLVGSGINEISVNPGAVLCVREQIGNLNYLYWKERVPEILSLSTCEEVTSYMKNNWAERV